MKSDTKTSRILACIGHCTTYAQLLEATGYDIKLLMNIVAGLKRRGYVERINEGAPRREIAFLRITTEGTKVLNPKVNFKPAETMVAMAMRSRPVLATVWSAA